MADQCDELDYHITFPSPASSDPSELNKEEPVVVLLGWAGCQDKHLSKYSAIYETRRCITIRYTAPSKNVFYSQGTLPAIAAKILELLEDLQLVENPVFFHVFSNGGAFLYQHITELIHENKDYGHVCILGTIFDSCPAQRRVVTAGRAFYASIKHLNFIVRFLASCCLVVYLMFAFLVKYLGSFFTSDSKTEFWQRMKQDPARCPQLFLYSKADKIVRYQDIDEIIRHRQLLGVHVSCVCWEDSEHVSHFRNHRESYINQCYDFVDMCLGRNKTKESSPLG